MHFTKVLSDFLARKTSAASMTSTASVASMPLQPHFIQKMNEFDVSINHGIKITYSGLLMWERSSKIHHLIDFLAPFVLEAVEDRDVTFHQIKGS
jgi:hypothetical protein